VALILITEANVKYFSRNGDDNYSCDAENSYFVSHLVFASKSKVKQSCPTTHHADAKGGGSIAPTHS
jgi:hypothetical protein